MSGILLIIFLVSGIVGIKQRKIGLGSGLALAIITYFLFEKFKLSTFLISILLGLISSLLGVFLIPWFFSGFKGGRHNTGPSYMGGSSCKRGGPGGGIVLSDSERKNLK